MTTEELIVALQKDSITTVNTNGLLNTEQSKRFIQTTVDESAFLKEIRVETGIGTARDLDNIGVGTRLLYAPSEDIAPDDAVLRGVSVGKRTLTPVEVMLPYNISLKYLEENLEKAAVEETINSLFARQFGNDLLDLAFNGDSGTAEGVQDRDFLKITDSFFAHLEADANKQYHNRNGSTDWKGQVFPALLKLMPSKYKANVKDLVFLTSSDVEDEYRSQLAERNTNMGDAYLVEADRAKFKGVSVQPVPFLPYGKVMLTNKKNLALGIGREISVYKMVNPRHRRLEYTVTAKIDFNYVLTDLITYTK